MSHKTWVDNEYRQWVKALQESTVDNFGWNKTVKRMLGEVDFRLFPNLKLTDPEAETVVEIMQIGNGLLWFKGIIFRMVYYAQKVLKQNPSHICEIGGGVGQFYAVLRALGYKGKYFIFDLPEVKEFQRKYLDEVEKRTGLECPLEYGEFDFCCSFYCLGELDDETKEWYVENVVKKTPHGLIIWNPHSGASDKITFPCEVSDEYPLTSPGNKMIVW